VVDCSHGGATTVDPIHTGTGALVGDALAGTAHPLYAFAFQDIDGDNRFDGDEPSERSVTSFTLLRRTQFVGPLRVSRGEVRPNKKITLRARITRADWTTGRDQALDAPVVLQFRPAGSSDFQDVTTMATDRGEARARIRVQTSGDWRFAFAGSSTDAGSTSPTATVTLATT
jgi:hypothetical protein